ncbi:NAD-dependent epimerase/dehydratase family protein [Actinoplanes sp. NPDC051343]|uniref:NAD-dependent epimerase/dehydratase family protein n=1 Tax=Actinoplanes sp. NPDC051343 TaxID=3363906 RepID=UPI0037B30121
MRILITGAGGFVGRAITRELAAAGHELTLMLHQHPEPAGSEMHGIVRGDVRDAGILLEVMRNAKVERVCHLAGLTGVRDSVTQPGLYFDVNVGGVIGLLTAVQMLPPGERPALVFASSRLVYSTRGTTGTPETAETSPSNPYGVSKVLCERLVSLLCTESGMSAWSLRCFNISGGLAGITDPDLDRLIPRLLAAVRGEVPPPTIESPGSVRDYCHVADVARAFRLALESDPVAGVHRVVNVGSGAGVTTTDVLEGLEKTLGRTVPAVVKPSPPRNDASVADISAIHEMLGWRPALGLVDILADAAKHESVEGPYRGTGPR